MELGSLYNDLINRRAFYRGTNRSALFDSSKSYKIINQKVDCFGDVTHVMFDNGEWIGISAIQLVPEDTIDEVFAQAAGGPREMIVNEIARLKARLAELESALKVIDSL